MLLNDIDNVLVELMLERKIDTFLHVRHDDERAHRRGEIVVRVALEAHVFGEVFRLHQFADIMKIGADTAERRVCAGRFGRGLGEIRDDKAMMIGARRFDGHAAE